MEVTTVFDDTTSTSYEDLYLNFSSNTTEDYYIYVKEETSGWTEKEIARLIQVTHS